jgi:hypothetical protein
MSEQAVKVVNVWQKLINLLELQHKYENFIGSKKE